MSNQETTAPESEKIIQSIGEQGVADYLRRHPHFFENKPSLLADLRIPHSAGSAVSLVERQVAVLRDSNANLKTQLEGLIQVARENDKLNNLLHNLTLRLIDSDKPLAPMNRPSVENWTGFQSTSPERTRTIAIRMALR